MHPSQRINDEDFNGWMGHPVTRRLMTFLRTEIEDRKQDFIDGALILDDNWKSGMKQAKVMGRCEMAQIIIEISKQQLEKIDEE